jgi:hypothetical protein
MANLKEYEDTTTLSDVFNYLEKLGFTIPNRTFYGHAKAGKLRSNTDGVYTKRMVEEYINLWIKQRYWPADHSGTDMIEEDEEGALVRRKLKAEVLKLESAGAKAAYELDILQGKYIPKDEVYRELAGRAVILASGYNHMVYTRAAAWIDAVGGNQAHIDTLIAMVLEDQDVLLNSYANGAESLIEITP